MLRIFYRETQTPLAQLHVEPFSIKERVEFLIFLPRLRRVRKQNGYIHLASVLEF